MQAIRVEKHVRAGYGRDHTIVNGHSEVHRHMAPLFDRILDPASCGAMRTPDGNSPAAEERIVMNEGRRKARRRRAMIDAKKMKRPSFASCAVGKAALPGWILVYQSNHFNNLAM
jgi:hypothetical protein